MPPDTLHNLGLVGEKQFRFVSTSSHCVQESSFTRRIENRSQKRPNQFKHPIGGRPVVGPQQWVQESFQAGLQDALAPFNAVCPKIVRERTSEQDTEFPQ
jgi:hypothetical protein